MPGRPTGAAWSGTLPGDAPAGRPGPEHLGHRAPAPDRLVIGGPEWPRVESRTWQTASRSPEATTAAAAPVRARSAHGRRAAPGYWRRPAAPGKGEVAVAASQAELAARWEAIHGRRSGLLPAKGAAFPALSFEDSHGYRPDYSPPAAPAPPPGLPPHLERAVPSWPTSRTSTTAPSVTPARPRAPGSCTGAGAGIGRPRPSAARMTCGSGAPTGRSCSTRPRRAFSGTEPGWSTPVRPRRKTASGPSGTPPSKAYSAAEAPAGVNVTRAHGRRTTWDRRAGLVHSLSLRRPVDVRRPRQGGPGPFAVSEEPYGLAQTTDRCVVYGVLRVPGEVWEAVTQVMVHPVAVGRDRLRPSPGRRSALAPRTPGR
jgi:hypothetical protein